MSENLHERATALANVLSNAEVGSSDLDVLVLAVLVAAGVEKPLPAGASTPLYTTSANVILDLFERRLPDWEWLRKSPGVVTLYENTADDRWAVHFDARGKTFPLAFLAALLPILTREREPFPMGLILDKIPKPRSDRS